MQNWVRLSNAINFRSTADLKPMLQVKPQSFRVLLVHIHFDDELIPERMIQ